MTEPLRESGMKSLKRGQREALPRPYESVGRTLAKSFDGLFKLSCGFQIHILVFRVRNDLKSFCTQTGGYYQKGKVSVFFSSSS